MKGKLGILITASVFSLYSIGAYANNGKTQGFSVDYCKPAEMDKVMAKFTEPEMDKNFCTNAAASIYKKFTAKNINFAKNYVLVKMYNNSFVALEPVKKQVFVLPYTIEHSEDYEKVGKITFNRKSNTVCTYGTDTIFNPYSKGYVPGDSSNPEYKLCIDFTPGEGFDTQFYPVNIKTGKVESRL